MNHTEIMTTHGVGRPLSEAQRSHLTGLIAAMNVAQIKLQAAQEVNTARLEAAQTAYDSSQAAAQSFLNYCGVELGCTFSDGDWQFDQQIMAFVRVEHAQRAPGHRYLNVSLFTRMGASMPSTIRDLTELTTVAVDDYILISDTSDVVNRDKRISKANFSGGSMSGGGLIQTAGFTMTLPASGTAVLRSAGVTAGRVASWLDANYITDGGFAVSDTARLGVAQSFSALKTFSAGLSFGQNTLNFYELGTWTPGVTFGGGSNGMTFSGNIGRYIRIGTLVNAWATIRFSAVGSSTGSAVVTGLPYASVNVATHRPPATIWSSAAMSFTGTLGGINVNATTEIALQINNNGVISTCTNAHFTATTVLSVNFTYETP